MISILLLLLFAIVSDLLIVSLDTLFIAAIILIILYRFDGILKYTKTWYIISLMLGLIASYFYDVSYFNWIIQGHLSIAIFMVIMFAGVFDTSWLLTKRMLKYRGMLSIIGFIIISPHALLHLLGVIGSINLFGIAAYALMIPLTIISFQVIRREIKPKDWNTIQKASYLIYILLFVHVLWVASPYDQLVYIVMMTLYINNKLIKEFKK